MNVKDWKEYGDTLAILLTMCGKALDGEHDAEYKVVVAAIRRSCCRGLFETFATHTQLNVAKLSIIAAKDFDTMMIKSFYEKLKSLVSYGEEDD